VIGISSIFLVIFYPAFCRRRSAWRGAEKLQVGGGVEESRGDRCLASEKSWDGSLSGIFVFRKKSEKKLGC